MISEQRRKKLDKLEEKACQMYYASEGDLSVRDVGKLIGRTGAWVHYALKKRKAKEKDIHSNI
ncbi:MAG TPA: hypothetical protein VJH75_04470 [Patescibacteria group bacterium]|nr:hypothetical protein [Patescibacteria group bacterium]